MRDYKHILLVTDFSDASVYAAMRAADLARRYDAHFTLLHIVEHFPEDSPTNWIAPEGEDPARYVTQVAQNKLAAIAEKLQVKPDQQQTVLSHRSVKYELVRYANEQKIDLIVIGANGRTGLNSSIGSPINGMLHGTLCDVLAVHCPRNNSTNPLA